MLYKETVHPDTFSFLEDFTQHKQLSSFYLVGGTALSLQLGHRISTDLDLFSAKDFDKDRIIDLLNEYESTQITAKGENLVHAYVNGIKVDFACHKYKVLKEGMPFHRIHIASIDDIAAMKLAAILSRAKKRDYVDLAALLSIMPLASLLDAFLSKYEKEPYNTFMLIRGLGYFQDVDEDETPLKILDDRFEWKNAKRIISKAIRTYT